jgi:DNA helicase II / ATP-dependent DNA helicase PcrA
MSITTKILPNQLQQFHWITMRIKDLIENQGVEPNKIAILSRKHPTLQGISQTLLANNIPFSYEKKEDVLSQKHIQELIILLQFTNLILKNPEEADPFLSKILGFKWLEIEPLELWKIALEYRNNWVEITGTKTSRTKFWSEVILDNPVETSSKKVLLWLMSIALDAQNVGFETIIDKLIGANLEDEGVDENGDVFDDSSQDFDTPKEPKKNTFHSKYKEFYFDNNTNKTLYTKLLSNLRKLIHTIRDYQSSSDYSLNSSVNIINNLTKNNLQIIDNSPFNNPDNCVNLMTVHSSKGLEFPYVFVINCQKKDWQKTKASSNMITLPMNLRTASKEDYDDFVRLFFVAVTRAMNKVILTGYEYGEDNKPELLIDFLGEDFELYGQKIPQDDFDIQIEDQDIANQNILEQNKNSSSETLLAMLQIDYHDLLAREISNYKLSVTHLTNYLDVTKGGPKHFLENNLLRFPYSKNPKSKYGTAMHGAITRFYHFWQKNNSSQDQLLDSDNNTQNNPKPELSILQSFFQQELRSQCLDKKEYEDYLELGLQRLESFYIHTEFDLNSRLAVKFALEDVVIDGARVTGELDKADFIGKEIIVTDYKTGAVLESWGGTNHKAIKAWTYKTQLEFYKLLVESSRTYSKYTVQKGVLEFVDNFDNGPETLELLILEESVDKLKKLIPIVFAKITNLDFPDVDHYPQSLKGINEFVDDLLEGKV